jgi:hypothetical protein
MVSKKAIHYATKACELVGWKNANFLSTLAAAYAEEGNFLGSDQVVEEGAGVTGIREGRQRAGPATP